jgi:Microsomal signal peptidase 25 kDa subunit (SPC25)
MGDWVKPLFNRYDPYVMKGKLDEFIIDELNNTHKFHQSFEYSNTRLGLGATATFFTIIAHTYEYVFDAHFPKDYYITAVCVIGYFLFNFLYQLFEYYYEKETFYSGNPNIAGVKSIDISSTIKRFDEFYTVKLFIYLPNGAKKKFEFKNSVGKYFSSDGFIVKSRVKELIGELNKEIKKKTA